MEQASSRDIEEDCLTEKATELQFTRREAETDTGGWWLSELNFISFIQINLNHCVETSSILAHKIISWNFFSIYLGLVANICGHNLTVAVMRYVQVG